MSIPKIASYSLPEFLSESTQGDTTWPAARLPWRIDPARAVLLVHDMQEYFLDFYARDQAPMPHMLANCQSLLALCRAQGIPIVYSAQSAQQTLAERGLLQEWWGPGLTAQPARAAICAELAPHSNDKILPKWRYSAFVNNDLETWMGARDQLIICGVYAHIGCLQSAADAFMRDKQVFFIADAMADFSREEHLWAMRYVAGRCGIVSSVHSLLQQFPLTGNDQQAVRVPESLLALRAQLAAMLEMPVSDLRADDNLLDLGLDSVRIMSLLQSWQQAGAQLSFLDLARSPVLGDWWLALQNARPAAQSGKQQLAEA